MPESKKTPVYFHFLRPFYLPGRTELKAFLAAIFRKEKVRLAEVRFIFCSDEYLLRMNRQYLNHDYYTDIITFNLSAEGEPVQGEIYISVDRVADNARKLQSTFREEMHRVMFHGILHLCGYKDKNTVQVREMRAREDYYLSRFFR